MGRYESVTSEYTDGRDQNVAYKKFLSQLRGADMDREEVYLTADFWWDITHNGEPDTEPGKYPEFEALLDYYQENWEHMTEVNPQLEAEYDGPETTWSEEHGYDSAVVHAAIDQYGRDLLEGEQFENPPEEWDTTATVLDPSTKRYESMKLLKDHN